MVELAFYHHNNYQKWTLKLYSILRFFAVKLHKISSEHFMSFSAKINFN